MTAPTRLVWETAGRPELIPKAAQLMRDHLGVCAVCNMPAEQTADVDKALGKNFTDRSLFHGHGSRVCHACLWACSGKGKETLRAWTIVCAPDSTLPAHAEKARPWLGDTPGLCVTTRGHTTPVIDMLTHPPAGPWVVSVATSGQKHVLPYAHVNHGDREWTVRMETVNVTSTPAAFQTVFDTVRALRKAGHRPDDITAGRPTLSAIKTDTDLTTWADLHQQISTLTNAPVLDLAAWCLTKEHLK